MAPQVPVYPFLLKPGCCGPLRRWWGRRVRDVQPFGEDQLVTYNDGTTKFVIPPVSLDDNTEKDSSSFIMGAESEVRTVVGQEAMRRYQKYLNMYKTIEEKFTRLRAVPLAAPAVLTVASVLVAGLGMQLWIACIAALEKDPSNVSQSSAAGFAINSLILALLGTALTIFSVLGNLGARFLSGENQLIIAPHSKCSFLQEAFPLFCQQAAAVLIACSLVFVIVATACASEGALFSILVIPSCALVAALVFVIIYNACCVYPIYAQREGTGLSTVHDHNV